ncbi:MAG: 3-hydroxy-9,10-secoandrosta-1,3,5(10)-triene-9,17-dione monooxygenase [Gammaproteobacteria bacterium]|jgi:3-hydroxy-9,10-secoandrosta-1,3,5(10)-triene-9,17-dione monooxygenase
MTVTKEELLERVNGLLPAIAARAEQSEQDRKPHPDTIQELIDIEVMQTLVPKCFGGHELGIDTLTAVARAVSSACMSTGWVTAFYLGHNWMLTKFSEEVQREVFADRPFGLIPIQPSPGVSIKQVTGGYEISGRSNFSSGIMNADWVVIAKSGGEDARAFVVPVEDVEIVDVWHMSGMSGTGSNDIITQDLFVPEHRTLPARDLFEATPSIHKNPLYTMPLLPFIYCEVMGVYCGGLEGATAAYEGLMQEKITTWGNEVLAKKQAVHIYLGDAHSQTRTAGILLERLVSDTQELIAEGSYPLDARLDLKLRAGHIGNLCREAMNTMMSKAGTRSFRKDFPLQRFFRDLNTLTSHAFIDWDNSRELFGRHRLGLEPNHPLF